LWFGSIRKKDCITMPTTISFRQWWRLFTTGRTKGVYLALISFAIYSSLILYNRLVLFSFILNEIGLLTSFGVLVDLVSHLFSDSYKTDISSAEWLTKFKGARTHDAYGIIIQLFCSSLDMEHLYLLFILWISLLIEFYFIYRSKFYH
jgi:hypothetical protein